MNLSGFPGIPRWLLGVRVACFGGAIGVATSILGSNAVAQNPSGQKEVTKGGYVLHQSVDLGGHIANISGSGPMYSTLVNLQSGPRILSHYFTMRATDKKHFPLFDSLTTTSSGYGGDPNNVSTLRMSKGKLYDFTGMFRRDRQYFDYNLLGNPLVPSGVTSNGYTFPQVGNAPHLFNTVRHMTDVNFTLLPISKVTFRAGYSQNISQGPSYSSVHEGTEGLLYQNWRNSTDTWLAGVDWKPLTRTAFTFEEHITHYKGDTTWQLAGTNLQLSSGAPVSLGFDNVSAPSCTGGAIRSAATNPPTANALCNGYLQYSRSQPTRTLFPTEEFRFFSSDLKAIKLNGGLRYTGANLNVPNFSEYFNGLTSRTTLRASTTSGNARAQRINVSANFGAVWQIGDKFSVLEHYEFDDFRQPAVIYLSEIDQLGSSMLVAPGAAQAPAITSGNTFLGQKTHTNTLTGAWDVSPKVVLSLSYRYRSRRIDRSTFEETEAAYPLVIHENGGSLDIGLHPTPQWRLNGSLEVLYADKAFTQVSPRALQHYKIRSVYKPRPWATISGAFNDLERRNNVLYVNHLDHSRSASVSTSLMPNEHYGLEASYGYVDVFTRTGICYTATPAPTDAVSIPAGTSCGTNTYLGTGYYDAPTSYGAIGVTLVPTKKFHTGLGYRINAVNGSEETLNTRQVPGTLQSQFHTPYANVAWTLMPGWSWKADWNYYAYGEASAVGPTLPRSFHSNIFTIGVHHEF